MEEVLQNNIWMIAGVLGLNPCRGGDREGRGKNSTLQTDIHCHAVATDQPEGEDIFFNLRTFHKKNEDANEMVSFVTTSGLWHDEPRGFDDPTE